MADKKHLEIVLKGAEAIAEWRENNPDKSFDLRGANLRRADLVRAHLNGADLQNANLEWADLRWADLIGANLSGARLIRADFHKADLSGADLRQANLTMTNLEDADLSDAILDHTIFGYTRLLNTTLSKTHGLETSEHQHPSIVDKETIAKSGPLPETFKKHLASSVTAEAVLAGYEFEREVAAIYRALGAKVSVDVGLAGSQIDILLKEQTETGSEVTVAVECKSTKRPVGIESIVSFASMAQLLKQRGLIDRATLVSRSGFTRHARQAAAEYTLELLELADLKQRVKGKQKAVKKAKEEFDQQQSTREFDSSKRIFVVMPFAIEFEDIYLLGIRDVAENLGFIVERADDIEHNENILDVVLARIKAAHAIIGDTTGSNPNVFYEIGYAHALERPTVLIARKGSDLPFDLRSMNHILYETIFELKDRLKKRLTSVFATGDA